MEGYDRVDRKTWFRTVEESRGAGGVKTRQGMSGQPLGIEARQKLFLL